MGLSSQVRCDIELDDALELEDCLCDQCRSEEGSAEYECRNDHDLPAETLNIGESGSDGNTGDNQNDGSDLTGGNIARIFQNELRERTPRSGEQ